MEALIAIVAAALWGAAFVVCLAYAPRLAGKAAAGSVRRVLFMHWLIGIPAALVALHACLLTWPQGDIGAMIVSSYFLAWPFALAVGAITAYAVSRGVPPRWWTSAGAGAAMAGAIWMPLTVGGNDYFGALGDPLLVAGILLVAACGSVASWAACRDDLREYAGLVPKDRDSSSAPGSTS